MNRARLLAIFSGVAVSLIWASSFIVIKMGLRYLNPLTLAGLRYFIAFVLLAPWLAALGRRYRKPALNHWKRLLVMGICAYPLAMGMLFLALQYLSATAGSFLFSMTPLPILFLGILMLREVPTGWQYIGVALTVAGSILFFLDGLSAGEPWGLGLAILAIISYAVFSILGRGVVRAKHFDTVTVTAIPLCFGGGILLLGAIVLEGMPEFSLAGGAIVIWLAGINTALAYILYNYSLKVLTALELNILLNLMPLETALMAWLVLNDKLTLAHFVGMITVILGVVVVQWKTRGQEEKVEIVLEA